MNEITKTIWQFKNPFLKSCYDLCMFDFKDVFDTHKKQLGFFLPIYHFFSL